MSRGDIQLINGEFLHEIKKLSPNSIDDIITDLPYGITNCKWDTVIPFDVMWSEIFRVLKPTGNFVTTCAQPFTSALIMSNPKDFRYEMIWQKTIGSGQLNIKRRPLVIHENIVVFYRKFGTYNEQLQQGKPYTINRSAKYNNNEYNQQKPNAKNNTGYRHAKSVISISNPRIKNGHPTQKPVELFEYLIKTFTNENDLVLDPFMGSGTTLVACATLNRKGIGIEQDEKWFNRAKNRLL